MMREASEMSLFDGYKVGTEGIEVNLLQYVDDTIFVGDMRLKNVVVVKSILKCIELVSGLKVNFL